MKIKNIFITILFLLISSVTFSQVKDQYGNYDIKKLTYDDMVRIFGDIYKPGKIYKVNGVPKEIREVIIGGNKIKTVVFNYGSITKPNYLGNIADLVWQGLGYGFEFGPLAAGEVLVPKTGGGFDTLQIVSDSHVLTTQGDYSPDGTLKWGWLPKSGYADPKSTEIARLNALDNDGDGKPDSWPERWYLPGAGKYVWPAFLGDQATAPDEEVYYVVDDYTNAEFPYYPFLSDSTKRGLGLDMEVRLVQFNNPLAEDILFLLYQVTNASDLPLNRVYFGMHGDPHIGGPSNYSDDRAYFIPPSGILADPYPVRARSMVYGWDDDMKGDGGKACGYFGWKFLESPTNSTDGEDNDDDGYTDESPFNSAGNYIDGIGIPLTFGITDVTKYTKVYGAPKPRFTGDENGDWNPARDDIGIDGIGPDSPNYPGADYGEADGVPSQAWYLDVNDNNKYDVGEPISDEKLIGYKWAGSEPHFGLRDVMESDQIGLSSFHAATYTNSMPNVPKNDPLMWEWLSSDTIDANQELLNNPGDNVFNFGTGPLVLKQGETQRFSMCILFGDNLNDLVLNAETSTRILEANYQFAQPPIKPIVKVVPGDGKVTLYWDTRSEESVDPLTTKKDFQGYKIYRSRDYTFQDVYTITDGNGVPFLGQALFDPNTGKRAQWDLIDSLSGYHPVEYTGRAVKYYLGDNTGLVHSYVDSTVKNGITYYYAVVAYDGGSLEVGKELPPTECQSTIQVDPITGKLKFDVNTAEVTPGPIAKGTEYALAGINGLALPIGSTNSTGKIQIKIFDNLKVEDRIFNVSFSDSVTYSIKDSTGIIEKVVTKDTVFVTISKTNVVPGTFELYDAANNLVNPNVYVINNESGKLRGKLHGDLGTNQEYTAKYKYYPVYKSKLINGEDGNPSFDGMRAYVYNDSLVIDQDGSKFTTNPKINVRDTIYFWGATIGQRTRYRADWEIRFNDLDTIQVITTTDTTWQWKFVGDTARSITSPTVKVVKCPFTIWNVTENKPATYIIEDKGVKNKWEWGERIIIQPQGETAFRTSYDVVLSRPTASIPVYPKSGDIYLVRTLKPFKGNDEFVFSTKAAEFKTDKAKEYLSNIYVVPNPYVGYSPSENPGRLADLRGEKNIQFRNLPPKCTIRIYTITGELVQTIQKDDRTSMASWDLLTFEGQRIAYGVYIYHIEVPEVGEKIGRIAVIK